MQVRPLLKVMKFIGTMYGGKSVAQVALNYLVAKGAKYSDDCRQNSLDWFCFWSDIWRVSLGGRLIPKDPSWL